MPKKAISVLVVACILFSFSFTGCKKADTSSDSDINNSSMDSHTISDTTVQPDDSSSEGGSSDDNSTGSSQQPVTSDSSSQSPTSSSKPTTKPKPPSLGGGDNDTQPTDEDIAGQLKVYTHNICSHGDEGSGSADRLPAISKAIGENSPNIVVLLECNTMWSKSIAKVCGYERVENTRTGLSEIQILYKADEFKLIENKVDDSARSAYHWAVLESKKTSKRFVVYGYHGTVQGGAYEAQQARTEEIKAMLALSAEKKLPTILTGDFNTTRESEEYGLTKALFENPALTAELRYDGPTHPGWGSYSRSIIDHLLYSKGDFVAKKFTVLDQDYEGLILSDHCAILATMEMK